MSSVKRKCKTLTHDEKRRVIKAVDEGLKKKSEIAKEFGIPPNTLSTIMKNREKYEAEGGLTNKKRCKSGEFKDVDECVLTWLKQCRDKNIPVSGPILQEKAIQYAESLGKKDFRASNGWLHNFKKRNEIIFRKVCGESASVNSNVCDEWKTELKKLTESYLPENIYNADETGLFFKCLPDRTLSF
ncbi:tigger transposable element-derived protein 6-like [Macrosteles quadrilineatus]|uniref:tigger transposable element-derived protein 6-like n=1 Tax=Macrosteles quadrilineatus TaxID=74068 RepID=UPI0023E091DC|nr:tigger transposable element-derived protein 6-like [Macrosteles quadrilineatus]